MAKIICASRELLVKELRRKPTDWLKSKLAPEWRQWLPIEDEQFHCDGERMVAEVFRCSTFINSEAVTSRDILSTTGHSCVSLVSGWQERRVNPAERARPCRAGSVRAESGPGSSLPGVVRATRCQVRVLPPRCSVKLRKAVVGEECVGAIVCKLDMHKKMFRRGYIAMLAVDSKYRRNGIGTNLVKKAIYAMVEGDCDEVVLETEITNKSALKLYENLGFVRDKRLFRYYLNGVDALRLKLWLR
ncbi:N-alpha-acetyltransferase MAK3 [Myotis lucifugus]|uniref:N-alpha-acetyltransferase MAK3 n=1 Tax=Myotis lucifugus TaxID=59463 RepID=UPI000CCC24D6|nr:N-alpha-acetyltransferase MAK3 [Myotis lucifugus]